MPPPPVVYDAGALIAAERDDARFRELHRTFLRQERLIIVPAPVLTQVWRGDARQARLNWSLRACVTEPTVADLARAAGVLLGRAGRSDAVDGIVVAVALSRRAAIVTSDPDDLIRLWDVAGTQLDAPVITV